MRPAGEWRLSVEDTLSPELILPRSRARAGRYAWYVAGLFTLANALSFSDRQVFALLLQPIKVDLHLTDVGVSLLHGLAFVVLYAVIAIPVARLADVWSRRKVVAAAVLTWSLMMTLCSVARRYSALFAARVGVGAGEGGLSPAAQSMLADYFPTEQLPAALALYATGVYVGSGVALAAAGWLYGALGHFGSVSLPMIGPLHAWRVVMLAFAIPGLPIFLACAMLRDPARRRAPSAVAGAQPRSTALVDLWRQFKRWRRAYCGICLGYCIMVMVGAGTSAWIPTFFVRRYHWSLDQVGTRYGTIVFVCGVTGALCGGFLAAGLRRAGIATSNLITALAGFLLLIPFAVSYPLVSDPWLALWLVGGYNFFAAFPFGGGYAAVQEITPCHMRAQVVAVFLLLLNLLGQGLGPTLIAFCTDYVFADEMALQKSLALIALVASPLAVALLWYGRKDYTRAVTSC